MTVAVIDFLEVVQIEGNDGERVAIAPRTRRLGQQALFRRAAIGQTGERIGARQLMEFLRPHSKLAHRFQLLGELPPQSLVDHLLIQRVGVEQEHQ